MNFGDLITEIGQALGRPDDPYLGMLKRSINAALQAYTREFPIRESARIIAPGTAEFALPPDIDTPLVITALGPTVYGRIPGAREMSDSAVCDLAQERPGTPVAWYRLMPRPYFRTPDGSYLSVLSSDATDLRAVRFGGAYAETAASGTVSEYVERTENVVLNGMTAVTLTMEFPLLRAVSTNLRRAPVISVYDSAGPVARIESYRANSQYAWVRILPVPTIGTPLLVDYIPTVPYLVDDDQPLPTWIPWDYVYWSTLRQVAADMERHDVMALATQELTRVVSGERNKRHVRGDRELRLFPPDWPSLR